MSCSFCNTIFEDQAQQRLHYKLDWHRYNLKQRLRGFKSIDEDGFNILVDEGKILNNKTKIKLLIYFLIINTIALQMMYRVYRVWNRVRRKSMMD